MTRSKFDLTIWHKLGIYFGLLLIIIGGLMYIPTYVHNKLQAEKHAKEQGNPVWLEMDNIRKRKAYFDGCRTMPKLEGDIPNITCLGEANSLYPDRNWKQVAADNLKGK